MDVFDSDGTIDGLSPRIPIAFPMNDPAGADFSAQNYNQTTLGLTFTAGSEMPLTVYGLVTPGRLRFAPNLPDRWCIATNELAFFPIFSMHHTNHAYSVVCGVVKADWGFPSWRLFMALSRDGGVTWNGKGVEWEISADILSGGFGAVADANALDRFVGTDLFDLTLTYVSDTELTLSSTPGAASVTLTGLNPPLSGLNVLTVGNVGAPIPVLTGDGSVYKIVKVGSIGNMRVIHNP